MPPLPDDDSDGLPDESDDEEPQPQKAASPAAPAATAPTPPPAATTRDADAPPSADPTSAASDITKQLNELRLLVVEQSEQLGAQKEQLAAQQQTLAEQQQALAEQQQLLAELPALREQAAKASEELASLRNAMEEQQRVAAEAAAALREQLAALQQDVVAQKEAAATAAASATAATAALAGPPPDATPPEPPATPGGGDGSIAPDTPLVPPSAAKLEASSGFADDDGDGVPDSAIALMLMIDADGDGVNDGLHSDKLGLFIPQQGLQNGRPYYANDANPAFVMWWSGGKWWIGKKEQLGHNKGWLKAASSSNNPPDAGWQVFAKGKDGWTEMEGMVVKPADRISLEGETPGAAHADKLGTFVRCLEPWEGKPVYTREGFAGKWQILMWWHSGTKQWFVGRRSELGTKKGWLKLPSDDASPCGVEGSPEAGGWLVYDASSRSWVAAPDLNCIAAPHKEWHA